ncbi:MAG: TolC family protein [Polyangiaceae bacterium]|nr:TolC family protein [Polyangiaceae bacterium]
MLPNPTVLVEHNRSFTGSEDTETIAGIGFPLGIGGRRFLLSDAADERLTQRKAEANASLVDGALDLREALIVAVAAQKRAAIVKEQQEALSAVGSTISGLQKGGESSQHDQLRQSLEVEVHANGLSLQSAKATAAKARLGAFVDRPVDLSGLDVSTLAQDPPAGAPADHPRIAAFDAAIRASELEIEAANRRWVPDLEIFLGYRQVTANITPDEVETGHGFALRVGLPITFFDHGQGEASVAAAHAASARADKEIFTAAKRAEVSAADQALATLAPAQGDEDTVGRARKLLEQAKTLYVAGEGSVSDLLAARALVEAAALSAVDAEEARALARVAKMRALGSLLDADLDAACGVGSR